MALTRPPVIILAGGKGTRLQSLEASRPKPMILVGGKPFLHWMVDHYQKLGFAHFIISVGHMADVIQNYEWSKEFPGARFEFAHEKTPLGTGGATRLAFESHDLQEAWVINGDTFLPGPLPEVSADEAVYLALSPEAVFDAAPNLVVQGDRVVELSASKAAQYFDCGAVHITHAAIKRSSLQGKYSLDELLKPSMKASKVGYALVSGTCYDIGTPERYRRFESYLKVSPTR